jgi:hypothetical protein
MAGDLDISVTSYLTGMIPSTPWSENACMLNHDDETLKMRSMSLCDGRSSNRVCRILSDLGVLQFVCENDLPDVDCDVGVGACDGSISRRPS